jgi:hypothetical protein
MVVSSPEFEESEAYQICTKTDNLTKKRNELYVVREPRNDDASLK